MSCATVHKPAIADQARKLLTYFAAGAGPERVGLSMSVGPCFEAYTAGTEASPWLDGSEHGEQVVLFRFLSLLAKDWPELVAAIHAVPNGGLRSKAAAGKLKAEGVKAGVPDICVPVASSGFSSLRIELKASDGGKLTASQKALIPAFVALGNRVTVCHGWKAAANEIINYLWPDV